MTGPSKPIASYPVAELPVLPVEGAEGEPAPPAAPIEVAPAVAKPRVQAAKLDFVKPSGITVSLDFPFRLDGEVIDSVTVRRLTVSEVRDIAGAAAGDPDFDLYRFYVPMTGLADEVFLGLVEADGDRVIEACQRFLPRIAREVYFGPNSESGDASPSSSPAG